MFYLSYEIQHNFSIYNGLKTLEITPILMMWHELYPTHKHGCRNGDKNLNFSEKMAVFLVSSG